MNEIAKIENSISPTLSGIEREIAVACEGKKIKDIDIRDVQIQAVDLITKAYYDKGQQISDVDLALLSKNFGEELKHYFSTLTFEELKICFYNGARGVYGEFFGLNLATFYKWVTEYMFCQERMKAKKQQQEYIEALNKPIELTKDEKEQKIRDGIVHEFNQFKSGVELPIFDAGNVAYNYLEKKGLIKFTPFEKREFMEGAKRNLLAQKNNELRQAKGAIAIKDIGEAMRAIEAGSDVDRIIAEAKRIALKTIYKQLIVEKKELVF